MPKKDMRCKEEIQQTKAVPQSTRRSYNRLLVWHLNLARADSLDDIVRGLAVNRAADGLRCAEDLLGAVRKVLGEGL